MSPDPINPAHKTLEELVPELVVQGNETALMVSLLTEATDRLARARKVGNWLTSAVVVLLVLALLGLYDLQGKICPMVGLLRPEASSAAPSTERGRDIATSADDLAATWRCDDPR